jgi:hypothetical protein
MNPLLPFVVVLTAVGLASTFYEDRERRLCLQALAAKGGWFYSRRASHLAQRWTGPPFRDGSGRHPDARNALLGVDSGGRPLVVFDYRYYSGKSQRARTVLAVHLTSPLPAGTAPRPDDRSGPHHPWLRVRCDGSDVLCWSGGLLEPEQIVSAIAWLGRRVDSMQRGAGADAGAAAGVRAEAWPPVLRSSSAAGVLATPQTTSSPRDWSHQARSSALQVQGHVYCRPRRSVEPWKVAAIALGVFLVAVAALGTPSGSVDAPTPEVLKVRAELVQACAQHLGTEAADLTRSRVAGNAEQGYQVYLVSADKIPLGNCSAEVSGDGYRMLS